MSYFQTLYHPERYHGHNAKPPFFEGWYFKLVDRHQKHKFAIIPAIFKSHEPNQSHAFIQVLNGTTGDSQYIKFAAQKFVAAKRHFTLSIGQNYFTENRLALSLKQGDFSLSGTVLLGEQVPWPTTVLSPGIMGLFGYLPNMECNHGIVSMTHNLMGHLILNGEKIDFNGGKGYIEKDWGKSFPAGYVWMQSNHFKNPFASFIGSIAIIPWGRSAFPGLIAGLWLEGKLHKFATYNFSKTTDLNISDDFVEWRIKRKNQELHIKAKRAAGGLLYGPNRESMTERVGETMQAEIAITLKENDSIIFKDIGRSAGLEVHGDLDRLLALQKSS